MSITIEPEVEYATSVEANMAILRAMERIHFRQKLRLLMPLIARELAAAGVDFSKADFGDVAEISDDEIDEIYEDLKQWQP